MQQAKLNHYYSQVPFICITRQSDMISSSELKTESFIETFSFSSELKPLLNFISSVILDDVKNIQHKKESHMENDVSNDDTLVGASILLVEDNRINATLAQDMLENLGAFVTHAENGFIALELIKNGSLFDLVLMDCMMPIMDGFKATESIRQLPQAANKKLPIVALTANAMVGDKERCLSSGMSDYLSKPVRKKDLKNMLLKWLKNRKPSNTNIVPKFLVKDLLNSETKQSKKKDSPIFNSFITKGNSDVDLISNIIPSNHHLQPTVEKSLALAKDSTLDVLEKDYKLDVLDKDIIFKSKRMMKQRFPIMVEYFLEDTQNYINQIREGTIQNDYAQLVVPSHTIKSSARQMGAITVSELAKEIEVSARSEAMSFGEFTYLIDELQTQFDLSRVDFNNLLSDV